MLRRLCLYLCLCPCLGPSNLSSVFGPEPGAKGWAMLAECCAVPGCNSPLMRSKTKQVTCCVRPSCANKGVDVDPEADEADRRGPPAPAEPVVTPADDDEEDEEEKEALRRYREAREEQLRDAAEAPAGRGGGGKSFAWPDKAADAGESAGHFLAPPPAAASAGRGVGGASPTPRQSTAVRRRVTEETLDSIFTKVGPWLADYCSRAVSGLIESGLIESRCGPVNHHLMISRVDP